MSNAIIEKAKERFTHSHESLAREFGSIRAGRANASLLTASQSNIMVPQRLLINWLQSHCS